jgi:DNA polymerase
MIAVDTEATYSKDRSIGPLGVHGYVSHPETDHFMCSIYDGDAGLAFVGHPKDAPWDEIRGKDVCAHNYAYDRVVLREYEKRGYIPFPLEERGFCTSNLVSYLQAPRSLLDSCRELLGIGLDKTTRDKFKGKDYHTLPNEVKEEIARYALGDAKACWLLWKQFAHLMPEHEQWLSWHTIMMGDRGVATDAKAIEEGIDRFKTRLWEIEKEIPWANTHPVTSPIQLKNACREAGIPVPDSTATKDELFQAWSEKYANVAPFVGAVQQYRSINRSLKVLEAIQTRTHNGRARYGLKYFGANHTGRWSGDSGLNMQNLPRDEVDGVNIRECFMAAEGHNLFIADYSQIEARVTLWLCGDHEQLELVRNGMCVYEAHARKTMGYDLPIPLKQAAKDDKSYYDLRQYAKARTLGLGFGLGASRFQSYAKTIAGLDLTAEESERTVAQFRSSNPKLVGMWNNLGRALTVASREKDRTFELELPSGRTIRYWDVVQTRDGMFVRRERGGDRVKMFPGKLFENLVQATAREVFALAIQRIEQAGIAVVMHTHDEIVCEIPENMDGAAIVPPLMTEVPSWATGLPIGVEHITSKHYEK